MTDILIDYNSIVTAVQPLIDELNHGVCPRVAGWAGVIRGLPNRVGSFVVVAYVDALHIGRVNVAADPTAKRSS